MELSEQPLAVKDVTWRRVHWYDEISFLLRPTDSRTRVWRQRNTSFQDNHILGTTAFGGWGVTASQIEHGDDIMSTVDVLWVVALAFPDGGGV
jgi:hypothetical protein